MRDSFRDALFTFFLGLTASVVITIIGYFLDSARGSRTRKYALALAVLTALFSIAATLGLLLTDSETRGAQSPEATAIVPLPTLAVATPTPLPSTVMAETAPPGLIAYAQVEPTRGDYDLFVVRPDGSGPRVLPGNSTDNEFVPAWSSDGQQIAYLRSVDGIERIYLMSADGSERRPLPAGSNPHGTPAWSPDGQRIAYHYLLETSNWDICVAVVPTGGCNNLTQNHSGLDINPSWSPTGDQLVFESVRNGARGLYIVDMTSATAVPRALPVGELVPRGPKWSPDGTWIAFVAGRIGQEEVESDLYLIRPNGLEGPVLLGKTPEKERVPTWSPDNRAIAYHIDGNPRTIWRIDLATRERKPIVDAAVDSYWPAWSP